MDSSGMEFENVERKLVGTWKFKIFYLLSQVK
jgi:hypothetical protein